MQSLYGTCTYCRHMLLKVTMPTKIQDNGSTDRLADRLNRTRGKSDRKLFCTPRGRGKGRDRDRSRGGAGNVLTCFALTLPKDAQHEANDTSGEALEPAVEREEEMGDRG